jgi:hypothetical protein
LPLASYRARHTHRRHMDERVATRSENKAPIQPSTSHRVNLRRCTSETVNDF